MLSHDDADEIADARIDDDVNKEGDYQTFTANVVSLTFFKYYHSHVKVFKLCFF